MKGSPSKDDKRVYVECKCSSTEHVILLRSDHYDDWDSDFYIETQLRKTGPWYRRIIPAFKFLLGIGDGTWADTMVTDDSLDEIEELIRHHKAVVKSKE